MAQFVFCYSPVFRLVSLFSETSQAKANHRHGDQRHQSTMAAWGSRRTREEENKTKGQQQVLQAVSLLGIATRYCTPSPERQTGFSPRGSAGRCASRRSHSWGPPVWGRFHACGAVRSPTVESCHLSQRTCHTQGVYSQLCGHKMYEVELPDGSLSSPEADIEGDRTGFVNGSHLETQ